MQIDPLQMDMKTQFIYNMSMALGIHKSIYQNDKRMITQMPVSLYPYQISEQVYMKLFNAHRIWQKLILAVSVDREFVNQTFKTTANHDQFVSKILQLYNKYQREKVGVICTRVDYMGDQHPQLVQFNTISVGLVAISDYVQKLSSLLQNHRSKSKIFYPINRNLIQFVNSIQQALLNTHKKSGIILMVVHQRQFNFGDQNAIQLQILKRGYESKKATLKQLVQNLTLDKDTNQIFFSSKKVSVVYYRTAYSPSHYITEEYWKVRQRIQQSNSIVIPTFAIQLVNFKRMQVQLSKIQVLRKYLTQTQAQQIKSTFGEIYDFQNKQNSLKLIELIKTNKNDYVLKSNRQGGGNNYFGQDAYNKIVSFQQNFQQIQKYILMKKIKSTIFDQFFLANANWKYQKSCTSQFSTFGSFAYSGKQIIYNQCGGTLIRVKRQADNQGGIARDLAVISGCAIIVKQ